MLKLNPTEHLTRIVNGDMPLNSNDFFIDASEVAAIAPCNIHVVEGEACKAMFIMKSGHKIHIPEHSADQLARILQLGERV